MANLEAVRASAERALAPLGLELVDVELVGSGRARTLRLTVERAEGLPEGVDLEALTAASEAVSPTLDALDAVSGSYNLEVSSPGLERALRRPRDFRRFLDTTVSIKTHEAVDGARRHRGRLLAAGDEGVCLEVDGVERRFAYEDIAQARTVFEWGPAPKPGSGQRRAKERTR
jgi:ribosome maturation factor RimP